MSNIIPPQIETYLEKKADRRWINKNIINRFNCVVVVPAIKEYENIPLLIESLTVNYTTKKINTLILFVINNSDESPKEVIENNIRSISLLEDLKSKYNDHGLNIDYVNAATKGKELPARDAGVGLARKVGMDQALLYFNYSMNDGLIVCLDADCKVEANYLSVVHKYIKANLKAGVIKYAHDPDNEAIINYEIFLRYYVLGLMIADSPYVYHSIGSCMVIDPFTYVKIGGMNKKKAGEDFYFLEKAAKLVPITAIDETTVIPSSRKSWRVPFGTGQRMTRFFKMVQDEYLLYDPRSFVILKNFFSIYLNQENISTHEIISRSKSISPALYQFLTVNNFEISHQKIIDNSKSAQQINYQKKIWFDSFKTLKLIHHLRDNCFPVKPMFTALNEIFKLAGVENFEPDNSIKHPTVAKQIEYLTLLRKLT